MNVQRDDSKVIQDLEELPFSFPPFPPFTHTCPLHDLQLVGGCGLSHSADVLSCVHQSHVIDPEGAAIHPPHHHEDQLISDGHPVQTFPCDVPVVGSGADQLHNVALDHGAFGTHHNWVVRSCRGRGKEGGNRSDWVVTELVKGFLSILTESVKGFLSILTELVKGFPSILTELVKGF